MKKILGLLLAVLFTLGIVGCDRSVTTTSTTTTISTTTTTEEVTTTTETTTVIDLEPEFFGVQDIEIYIGDVVDFLQGITAVDSEDDDITDNIVVDSTGFDNETIGEYTINLSVTDSALNTVTASYRITVVLSSEQKAVLDVDSIVLDVNDLVLPRRGENNTNFYWTSSDSNIVSSTGFIMNPPVGADPVDVTLTVRAVNGEYETSKDFVFTIQPNPEVSVTSHIQLPFEGTSDEYVVADQAEFDVFYVDNGTVPYVDVESFLSLLDGAIESSILNYSYPEADVLRVEYETEYLDFDGVTLITETYYAEIDFTENTFTVKNYDFFAGYIASTESDYGEGLSYVDADFVDGQEVVIPLGFYNFDLTIYDDGTDIYYLMPLHVANRLFAGDIYYDVYYNGDKLWGVDTFVVSSGSDPALISQIRTSSLNLEVAAYDMKLASYNYLALVMDYFYGLKDDKGFDSYYDIISEHAEAMILGNDRNFYKTVLELVFALDDLHSWHQFSGYYEKPAYGDSLGATRDDLGYGTLKFYSYLDAIEALLIDKYGMADYPSNYSLIDNETVAIIHLTGFTIDTPDEVKLILDSLPVTVEDVVIDLAYNTGGNIGAVLRIFGYITEEQFTYHSQNPADGSAVTYYIESDYVAYDYNWYVLTSGVTFSAANMFASMAKELGIPVIGQKSSGGASSIGLIILPEGSGIFISTNNVLSTRVGDELVGYEYLSVEYGVEVDYQMDNVLDDAELIDIITQIKVY